jgi:alpha-glucosidase
MALERRYRLLPMFYTLFEESSRTGLPVARPTFFADPTDLALRSEDDSFLLGQDLLVVAKVTPLADRVAVMPKGNWRPLNLHGDRTDPDLPDLFVRPGAIITAGPIIQFTGEKPLDPLTLYVSLDEAGKAEGTLYEDEGQGYGYRSGDFLRTRYTATRTGDTLTVSIASTEGSRPRPSRAMVVRVLMDDGSELVCTARDGETLSITIPPAK